MTDVAEGMNHLHRHGLVHRDLKTLNLLVDEDENGNYLIRICDFGSSRSVDLEEYYKEYQTQQQSILSSFISSNMTATSNDIPTDAGVDGSSMPLPLLSTSLTFDNELKISSNIKLKKNNKNNYNTILDEKQKNETQSNIIQKLKKIRSLFSSSSSIANIFEEEADSYLFEDENINDSQIFINFSRDRNLSVTSQLLHQISSPMSTIVGSVQFLAPEILCNIEFKPNSRSAKSKKNSVYGFSADVYSYGCVIWEILTRREIYKGKSYSEIQKFVMSNNRPIVISSELHGCSDSNFLLRLMNQCWQSDAVTRPNFGQILIMLEERKDAFIPNSYFEQYNNKVFNVYEDEIEGESVSHHKKYLDERRRRKRRRRKHKQHDKYHKSKLLYEQGRNEEYNVQKIVEERSRVLHEKYEREKSESSCKNVGSDIQIEIADKDDGIPLSRKN